MLRIQYPKTTSFIILVLAIYWSFSSLMPSASYYDSSDPKKYSLDKALVHLKQIAKEPHYVGTKAHAEVRDYVVSQLQALGLEVHVEKQIGINEKWRSATNTQNIYARIKGTGQGKALLLLSHYDSTPHSSRGASDNGVGVATILEGVRVYLAQGNQPKNDIIILINDAEEIGLNGADAFVRSHPWAKDVGLVINFEARGSGGPSYMLMETNGGNQKMIQEYAKANPKFTVGNSLMYSIYKMLPNDTDLTVFREQGDIEGFNFAFIGDYFDYHSYQDSYENVDRNTMAHQATYLMPLLNYFSQTDLKTIKSNKDYVFFNYPIVKLLYYPFSWVLPMWIAVFFGFIVLIFVGMHRQVISNKEIAQSFKPFLISLFSSALLTFLGWKLLLVIYSNYNEISHGFTYNGYLYQLFFLLITLIVILKSYSKFSLKMSKASLLVAPITFWLLLNGFMALKLQGGGFFIIPVVLSLGAFAILIYSKRNIEHNLFWLALLAVPSILIFPPIIKMLPVGLGLKILFVSSVLIVFLLSLFSPIFMSFKSRKRLQKMFSLAAVVVFFMAHFKAPFNEDRKRPNSVNFLYDKDLNKSFWFTYDKTLDSYTKQVLNPESPKGNLGIVLSNKHKDAVQRYAETPDKQVVPATLLKVKDTVIGELRNITYHIIQQRRLNEIAFVSTTALNLKTLEVQGVTFDKKVAGNAVELKEHERLLTYFFTNADEQLEISFSFNKNENPVIELFEVSHDLLLDRKFGLRDRNLGMMPKPFVVNDAVIVRRKLKL